MGCAAVLNATLLPSDINRKLGRDCSCFSASTHYKAASGVASLRSICSTSRRCGYISRSLPHKLHATVEQQSWQEVHEYIVLFKVRADINNDDAEAMLDKFWSLQYMIPAGVLNGFAGPVKTMHASSADQSMTHAVHLRFGSLQHMHTFREHEKLQQARVEAQRSACEAIVEISVTSRVPKDLNSIFRKGADWDLGVDHILVLQAREDASQQEMQSFLQALADMGKSPAINAMQTTYGAMNILSGNAHGTHLVFTRLALQEELDALLMSPPLTALTENDARLPAAGVASFAMSIAPSQAQRSRTPQGQGVLGVSNT